jgi:transposase
MRKNPINLIESEIMTLREGHKNHDHFQFRDRCHCVLLRNEGQPVEALALIFGVIPLTIYNWLSRWKTQGLMGLYNKEGQGRRVILLEKDAAKIKEKIQANHQKLSIATSELQVELGKEFCQKTLERYIKKLVFDGKGGENA